MPDREKVMKGLKICVNCMLPKDCDGCPYEGERTYAIPCGHVLMADALALLKEQEARVMMKEEVLATPEGTVVWMEEEAESGTYIQPIVSTGNGCLGNFYIGVGTYGIDSEKRRFWTSRPTEEQRKAVPWEDDDA